MSELAKIALRTLKDLDHRIEDAFDQHIATAAEDCMDRASDDTTRKVQLTVEMKPQADQRGDCVSVHVRCKLKASVPAHVTTAFQCEPRRGGILAFMPGSPEDPKQQTLFQKPEDEKPEDDDDS